MRSLRRLFGFGDPDEARRHVSQAPEQEQRAANVALADDPVRFADWVSRYALRVVEPDGDLDLCPSEEQCQRLQITAEQRDACRREFSVMRALGACMFVGRNLPTAYYATFKREICAACAGMLYGIPTEGRINELSAIIDGYIDALGEDSSTAFSLNYLDRVYAGNPNEAGLFAVGIFQIPLQQAMDVFEAVQDGYCLLKFDLPFKAVEALQKVARRTSKPHVRPGRRIVVRPMENLMTRVPALRTSTVRSLEELIGSIRS